jgi:hypothetical protein
MHKLLRGLFLAYIAVLPIAETIALRNVLLVAALFLLGHFLLFRRDAMALPASFLMNKRLIPLGVWVAFLMLFPLWAQEQVLAWENLREQWGQSILAWLLGIGVVMVCGDRGPSVVRLAIASSVILLIHLSLTMFAWSGALGANVPSDLPLSEMASRLSTTWHEKELHFRMHPFPWGFRGFDPMHGNLGYSSSQAIGLLCAFIYIGWLHRRKVAAILGVVAILVCLASVFVAHSRGAVLYDLALVVLWGGLVIFIATGSESGAARERRAHRGVALWMTVALGGGLAVALISGIRADSRLSVLIGQARVAWMVPDPVDLLCNGMSDDLRQQLKSQLPDLSPAYADNLINGLEHDGIRVVLMRAGWRLVSEHPAGLDGSRHSFKKLLASRCGRPPAIPFAHSHNGWFDTALALGWAGAAVACFLLVYLAAISLRQIRNPRAQPWALALLLLSLFWLTRGVLDSVYREHYLQMQGAVLGYLFARLLATDTKFTP